ncbi:hypothetical protein [Metabacillus sp. RGM 3146]|uniref:hypothetical protein n=1 Tax=Metabacillus sp. RGM 3146 TaxID=3401092 RepID=UPI003B99CF49
MPYIEKILFPDSFESEALSRFSKSVNIPVRLNARNGRMSYEAVIHSIDFIVCPFILITLLVIIPLPHHKRVRAREFSVL